MHCTDDFLHFSISCESKKFKSLGNAESCCMCDGTKDGRTKDAGEDVMNGVTEEASYRYVPKSKNKGETSEGK